MNAPQPFPVDHYPKAEEGLKLGGAGVPPKLGTYSAPLPYGPTPPSPASTTPPPKSSE